MPASVDSRTVNFGVTIVGLGATTEILSTRVFTLAPLSNRRGFFIQVRMEVMNYVCEISELFQSRCSNVTILSPEDYTLIAEWEKEQIPIEIIAASINEICDRPNGSAAGIKSISYFQESIRKRFRHWLRTDTGKA